MPNTIEETDESYEIVIDSKSQSISLNANEYSGLVRGMATIA